MTDTEQQDAYLTVAEAAALLKVHPSTIWRWIDKGALPGGPPGRAAQKS